MQEVWYHVLGGKGGFDSAALTEELHRYGVSLRRFRREWPNGPGLLVVDDCSHDVCAWIRDHARDGLNCVLVLILHPPHHDRGSVWEMLRAGASDVLCLEGRRDVVPDIAARLERWDLVERFVVSPLVKENLVGASPCWIRMLRHAIETAHFGRMPVMLLGESGTGKELLARLIHTLDPRRPKGEMIVLDCSTIVPDLSGSEFFGHERGAFTGAIASRDGAFARANGGTLFLDEVGELPPCMQTQLMRVIQEGCYKRVGGDRWHTTSLRLICATNRDLAAAVADGTFRHDLYYRLSGSFVRLPPLRERVKDILLLARHFLACARTDENIDFDETVQMHLVRRTYPGNVRELKQLVHCLDCRHVGPGPITIGDLPDSEWPRCMPRDNHGALLESAIEEALDRGLGLKDIGREVAETTVELAFRAERGNLRRAARRLGVTERALQMRRQSTMPPVMRRGVREPAKSQRE